jgi:hypothetical protein
MRVHVCACVCMCVHVVHECVRASVSLSLSSSLTISLPLSLLRVAPYSIFPSLSLPSCLPAFLSPSLCLLIHSPLMRLIRGIAKDSQYTLPYYTEGCIQ